MHKKTALTTSTYYSPKCTKCRLVAVFCPDLLRELKCSPNLLAVARRKGENKEKEKERGRRERKGDAVQFSYASAYGPILH